MDEQGPHEASNEEAWERYMEAERHELQMRREGHLAKMLGHALPDESPEKLKRLAEEDRRMASMGLVELMDESGEIFHKHIDELVPEDRPARTRADGARIEWLIERRSRRALPPRRPGSRDPADQ